MIATETTFQDFAQGLIQSRERLDPETLRHAKLWYTLFAGGYAVGMADRDLVEIYQELH